MSSSTKKAPPPIKPPPSRTDRILALQALLQKYAQLKANSDKAPLQISVGSYHVTLYKYGRTIDQEITRLWDSL